MRLRRLTVTTVVALATLLPATPASADSPAATVTSATVVLSPSEAGGVFLAGTNLSPDLIAQVSNPDGSWGVEPGHDPVARTDGPLWVSEDAAQAEVTLAAVDGTTFQLRLLHPGGAVVPGVVTVLIGDPPQDLTLSTFLTTSGARGTSSLLLEVRDAAPAAPPLTGGTITIDGRPLAIPLVSDGTSGYWMATITGLAASSTYHVMITATNAFGPVTMEVGPFTLPAITATSASVHVAGLSAGKVKASTTVSVTGNLLIQPGKPIHRTWPSRVVLHVKDATGERTFPAYLSPDGDPEGVVPAGGGDPYTWKVKLTSATDLWVTFAGDDGQPFGMGAHPALGPASSPATHVTVTAGTPTTPPPSTKTVTVATSHLTQRLSAPRVSPGTTLTTTVTLTARVRSTIVALPATAVALWTSTGHGWKRVATVRTGRDGHAHARIRILRGTRLQWRYAGATSVRIGRAAARVTAGRTTAASVTLR